MTDPPRNAAPPPPPLELVWERLAPLRAYTVPPEAPPVKLDANESPWPLPPESREQLARTLAAVDLHRYPDPRASALREALCARIGGRPDELILGSGSDEIIALLMTTLGRPPGGRSRAAVLYPEPTFVMFGLGARVHGLDPVPVPLGAQWQLDLPAMLGAVEREQPNLIFLASPNNPTGNAFDEASLRALVESAPGSLVVIDEAYAPFSGRTFGAWRARHPNLAVLGTLSKIGFAAARVGWIRMHPELAQEVDKARQPFNLNTLSQETARLALTELWPTLEDQIAAVVRERARLARALAEVPGLRVWPSDANFLLVQVREGDAGELARALRERHVGVRHFGEAHGPLAGHVRITVGTPQENRRLLDALGALR
ncbi:MAG: histidinol-phosphate transaminase [Myxococcota bacterium]